MDPEFNFVSHPGKLHKNDLSWQDLLDYHTIIVVGQEHLETSVLVDIQIIVKIEYKIHKSHTCYNDN